MPSPSDTDIHHAVERAELDLERKVAQLKDVVRAKLETPEHVARAVIRPFAFIRAHATVIAAIAIAVGAALVVHHVRAHHAQT